MKILIPALIEKIEDEDIKGFVFRFYNTIKMVIIPVIMLYVAEDIHTAVQAEDIDLLLTAGFWYKALFGGLVSVLLSLLTGTEKIIRGWNI